jgi:hypothetical protein
MALRAAALCTALAIKKATRLFGGGSLVFLVCIIYITTLLPESQE